MKVLKCFKLNKKMLFILIFHSKQTLIQMLILELDQICMAKMKHFTIFKNIDLTLFPLHHKAQTKQLHQLLLKLESPKLPIQKFPKTTFPIQQTICSIKEQVQSHHVMNLQLKKRQMMNLMRKLMSKKNSHTLMKMLYNALVIVIVKKVKSVLFINQDLGNPMER